MANQFDNALFMTIFTVVGVMAVLISGSMVVSYPFWGRKVDDPSVNRRVTFWFRLLLFLGIVFILMSGWLAVSVLLGPDRTNDDLPKLTSAMPTSSLIHAILPHRTVAFFYVKLPTEIPLLFI